MLTTQGHSKLSLILLIWSIHTKYLRNKGPLLLSAKFRKMCCMLTYYAFEGWKPLLKGTAFWMMKANGIIITGIMKIYSVQASPGHLILCVDNIMWKNNIFFPHNLSIYLTIFNNYHVEQQFILLSITGASKITLSSIMDAATLPIAIKRPLGLILSHFRRSQNNTPAAGSIAALSE
ncbi:hypothetical protein ACJX0J_022396, partial [Zea mays]